MAVSLSAGYGMRSDFMISDAALPQRIEEAQAADFAGLIAQSDAASAAPKAVPEEQTAALAKEFPDDPQKLAEMVASGEVKPEEIPEELQTVELKKLIEALARMRGVKPAEEQDEADKPETQPTDPQIAASAAFVQADLPTDMTAELGEIAKTVTESTQVRQVEAVQQQAPVQPAEQLAEQPEIAQQEVAQSAQPVQTVQPEQAEQPEQAAQAFPQELQAAQEKPEQPVQTVQTEAKPQQAVQTELPAEQLVNAPQQQESPDNGGSQLPGQQAAPVQTVQQAQQKPDILKNTEFTVEVKPAQEEAPAQQAQTEMQLGAQAGQGRVKAASDELEMLRSAVKKPDEGAVRTDAPLMTDSPVVFRAENGRTVEVKPAEVAQQVTERLIETAKIPAHETEYTMTLNPEELGEITIKLTKAADGAISVTIAAQNSKTRELLEQNGALMQENLRANGMRLESWQTVNESQQETYAQDYNGSSKNPYYRSENPQPEDGAEDGSFAEIMASM